LYDAGKFLNISGMASCHLRNTSWRKRGLGPGLMLEDVWGFRVGL
jgi:hypothetical protein